MDDVLMCNVTFVCTSHCLAMLRNNNISITRCFCYFFSQPLHINTDAGYKKIASAFSIKKSYKSTAEDGSVAKQSKMALLSEIGILPPGMVEDDLKQLNVNQLKLASENGKRHLILENFPVEDYVVSNIKTDKQFADFVVVYIDPAPTETDRSFHAMSFIARATSVNKDLQREFQHYVILWVEEFATSWLKDGIEDAQAIATVFVRSTVAISRLYNAFFKTYYVIPEANSISLDRFQYHCEMMTDCLTELGEHSVVIQSAVMKVGTKRSYEDDKLLRKKTKILRDEFNRRLHQKPSTIRPASCRERDLRESITLNGDGSLHFQEENVLKEAAILYELQSKVDGEEADMLSATKYRLGYRLGNDKFARFCGFFSSCYNKSEKKR